MYTVHQVLLSVLNECVGAKCYKILNESKYFFLVLLNVEKNALKCKLFILENQTYFFLNYINEKSS